MAWSLLLTLISLSELSQHVLADPKVVLMKTRRKAQPRVRSQSRERALPSFPIQNERSHFMYEVDVAVGSPPQDITLDIDTGSSDIWTFSPDAYRSCNGLCQGGFFNPRNSSSYSSPGDPEFAIKYDDGSAVSGNYFSDILTIGNVTLDDMTMAVATTLKAWSIESTSIMGIGFERLEAVQGQEPVYPGISRLMVQQGLIHTRSYSLFLDEQNASTGTLLFGGYDTSKFVPPLTIVPIQPSSPGVIDSMLVNWTSLDVTLSPRSSHSSAQHVSITTPDFSRPALLDSGTSVTYLPPSLYSAVAAHFDTSEDSSVLIDCAQPAGSSLDFGFGGAGDGSGRARVTISVPFSELAISAYDKEGNAISLSNGRQGCTFGLSRSKDESSIILGDTFLRSAYVVYDLDAREIGLAQADWTGTREGGIVEIVSGAANTGPTGVTSTATAAATGSAGHPAVETAAGTGSRTQPGAIIGTTTFPVLPGDASATFPAIPGAETSGAGAGTGSRLKGAGTRASTLSGTGYVLCAVSALFALGFLQVVFM